MAYEALKEQEVDVISYLKKTVVFVLFLLILINNYDLLLLYDLLLGMLKYFSGQIYVNPIYWRQSGTIADTHPLLKNTSTMHGFQ